MTTITIRHFIARGPKADIVKADAKTLAAENHAKRVEFLDEFKAFGFIEYSDCAPHKLVFESDEPIPRAGFLAPEKYVEEERVFHTYRPDLRTKVGKALQDRLLKMGRFSFSNYVVRAFGVIHSTIGAHEASRSRSAMYFSVAGLYDDTLIINIPFGGDGNVRDVSIPEDLIELKRSQFVAITEEGQKVADVIGVEA